MKKDDITDKGLLSVKELSVYLSMGQTKVRELLNQPYNPFTVRIGGRVYANKKALDKWLEQRTGI